MDKKVEEVLVHGGEAPAKARDLRQPPMQYDDGEDWEPGFGRGRQSCLCILCFIEHTPLSPKGRCEK